MAGRTPHLASTLVSAFVAVAVVVVGVLMASVWFLRPAPPGPSAPSPVPPSPGRSSPRAESPAPPAPPDPVVAAAREVLPGVAVRAEGPSAGYARELFGQAWSDDVSVEGGHDGCDTRNDVLRRDLREVTLKPGTRGCVVLSGVLQDPYTGERIAFERAGGASPIQIDHVVALSDAWRTGAAALDPDRRRDLANDPLGLLAVSSRANQSKSGSDAAEWLPPRAESHCGYVARQVLVKHRYGLWTTPGERAVIDRVMAGCA